MTKDELAAWALANGWQMIDGNLSLTKPSSPRQAIVRLLLKGTVASVEVKKPAGKWEKVSSESYKKISADPETGFPRGLGLDTISGFTMLIEDNKNRNAFSRFSTMPRPDPD